MGLLNNYGLSTPHRTMNLTDKSWEDETFPLVEAAKELKAADAAYRRMLQIGLGRFTEYDRAWRDFLHCVDRAWNKLSAEAEGKKNWPKLKSEFERLRKTDPLLKYVVQARNASEHSIDPIIRDWQPNLRVTPTGNGALLEWDEWERPLLSVTNRGTIFHPPKKHLGKPMSNYRRKGVTEPHTVAELTMAFYVAALNRVSREVFPGGKSR